MERSYTHTCTKPTQPPPQRRPAEAVTRRGTQAKSSKVGPRPRLSVRTAGSEEQPKLRVKAHAVAARVAPISEIDLLPQSRLLLPPAQAQVAHVLQPSTCGEGGGAGGLEGAEALGATRALTWPQAAFGIYSRCFLHCFAHGHRRRKPSAPGAFCTVLPMSTGGVSHLLQVLFALFCSWSKWLKPPAFLCKRL